jgi:hypothetical protein
MAIGNDRRIGEEVAEERQRPDGMLLPKSADSTRPGPSRSSTSATLTGTARNGLERPPRSREWPPCLFEVVGEKDDDLPGASRDAEPACHEVGGEQVMRDGQAREFAPPDGRLRIGAQRVPKTAG